MTTPFLDTARRVILTEAEALTTLANGLDERFRDAIDLLRHCRGRVIVTGIGKSGHIGNKIAATLASTGTPAQFVHPAEASHGDLGMITRDDVVLAISNGGEAAELANLIAYSRRYDIPLIGLTSQESSTLGRQSDVILLLPQAGEACGTGIVPTNSTAMTLAMGDALAVALMENRAFTAEHFRDFHPGGKLGAQLSRVSDLMHRGAAIPLVHHRRHGRCADGNFRQGVRRHGGDGRSRQADRDHHKRRPEPPHGWIDEPGCQGRHDGQPGDNWTGRAG